MKSIERTILSSILSFLLIGASARAAELEFQAQGEPIQIVGRMIGAMCNARYGVGEATFVAYFKKLQGFRRVQFNVVNEDLCKQGALLTPSRLVDFGMDSFTLGRFHRFTVNRCLVVTGIESVEPSKSTNKLYKKFKGLDISDVGLDDYRHLKPELLGVDENTTNGLPDLLKRAIPDADCTR